MKKALFLIVFGLAAVGVAQASSLNTLRDTVSRHAPSTASDHDIRFNTQQGIGNTGESFSITFDSGFDLSPITVADINLSNGATTGEETSQTLTSLAGASTWGIGVVGSVITFTHPTNNDLGDIAPNDFVVINTLPRTGMETPQRGVSTDSTPTVNFVLYVRASGSRFTTPRNSTF